jgi:hypothetical protein
MILVASLAMAAENPTAIRATFWSSNIADLIEPLPESSSIGASLTESQSRGGRF